MFETSARILSLATDGASHTRIMALHQHVNQEEIRLLLKSLVERDLLELDSSATTYWTTVNGVKFLEIHFHMERMLHPQKSLI